MKEIIYLGDKLILGRRQVFLDATYAVYMWILVDLLHLSKGELKDKFDFFDICRGFHMLV